jgi:hypothetical protein
VVENVRGRRRSRRLVGAAKKKQRVDIHGGVAVLLLLLLLLRLLRGRCCQVLLGLRMSSRTAVGACDGLGEEVLHVVLVGWLVGWLEKRKNPSSSVGSRGRCALAWGGYIGRR